MKLLHFESIRSRQMAFFFFVQDEGGAKAEQNAGFRVMLKYCEIKKAFRYYIKQIDSMLPCVWFSNRSQKTSKCGKNISETLGYASCATYFFLPHFDVICDLLLNRRTATWNLFVKWWMDFKERSTLGGALYTNWNQFRTSGVIHRFIATVLFRMAKDWPHSSGNINEWPVNLNAGD